MSDPKRLLEHPEILSPEELSALQTGAGMSSPKGLADALWVALLPPLAGPDAAGAPPGAPGVDTASAPPASPVPSVSSLGAGAAGAVKAATAIKGAATFGLLKFFVVGSIAGTTVATGVAWNAARSRNDMALSPSGVVAGSKAPPTGRATGVGSIMVARREGARAPTVLDRALPSDQPSASDRVSTSGTPFAWAPPSALPPQRGAPTLAAPPLVSPTLADPPLADPPLASPTLASPTLVPPPAYAMSASVLAESSPPDTRRARAKAKTEVALVQLARDALRSGEAPRALGYLAQADREVPDGVLGQEREVLTIEALAATGRAAGASERARAYLAAHPESPFVERVRKAMSR